METNKQTTRKRGVKERKEKKTHTEEGKENGHLIFLLSVGDKWKILKLMFNTINCLMKHNNLLC